MAGVASAHQAAIATREDTGQQRAGRTQRTTADPQRAQQGATAAAAAAPAALDSLSRLQQLANASPQVAQLRRLQALADGRFAPVAQLAGGPEEEELVQGKFATAELQPQQAPRINNTGLPDQLKSGIESLSGLSMDHVRVHYNSAQPAQLNALAYAQGRDIHLAPGQERHLPHEAWHVVQQAQGRVRPTLQLKDGVQVNDDVGLEREADVMGIKALEGGHRVVEAHRSVSMPIEPAQQLERDTTNSPDVNVANNHSAPFANGPGLAQRGENEMQRIADQGPEAALQRQVQACGDGVERVGGKRQDMSPGFFQSQQSAAAQLQQAPASVMQRQRIDALFGTKATGQGPAPRPSGFIQAATRTSAGVVQLFNPNADDPYVPTRDALHPALVNAGFVGLMGPYRFRPMQGDFQYQEPSIAGDGVETFLRRAIRHKTAVPQYGPENLAPVGGDYKWFSPKANKQITFHAGGIAPADPANRVAKATLLYKTEKDGGRTPGAVLDRIKAAGAGAPRAFVSVANEDALGAAAHAHTMDRHVVGGGAGIPDADAVAGRALFGKLGGIAAGAVAGVYTPIATAFQTAGGADAEVAAVINGPFTANWNQYREDLVSKGIVELQVSRLGKPVVAYSSASGAKVDAKYVPAYLGGPPTGRLPLYNLDPRWTAWANKQNISAAAQNQMALKALAVDESAKVNKINVRILSSEDLKTSGWFVHSAFPIV